MRNYLWRNSVVLESQSSYRKESQWAASALRDSCPRRPSPQRGPGQPSACRSKSCRLGRRVHRIQRPHRHSTEDGGGRGPNIRTLSSVGQIVRSASHVVWDPAK